MAVKGVLRAVHTAYAWNGKIYYVLACGHNVYSGRRGKKAEATETEVRCAFCRTKKGVEI